MTGSPRLRLARASDAAAILEVYRPFVEETSVSFETDVPTAAEVARRIERALDRHVWLVAEQVSGEERQLLGYAYSTPHRARAAYQWTIETTVYVAPRHARRGIARALYEALLAVAERQGYRRALAIITLPNEASQRFHAALGFDTVGRFEGVGFKAGAWHTTECRARSLVDSETAPEVPRPWDAAMTGDELEAVLVRAVAHLH